MKRAALRTCSTGSLVALAASILLRADLYAQPGFTSLSTVRMEVKYQHGVTAAEAQQAADYLQTDYEYLSTTLGVDLGSRLEVRIYGSQGKYLDATGLKKPWRYACYLHGMIHVQPVSTLVRDGELESSLSYELALAILNPAVGKGCPGWLREAYAVYHSGIMTDLTPPVGARVNSFADLEEELQQNTVPPRRLDVLYLLGQTMRFFIERYGEEKAFGVFKAFDGKTAPDRVLETQFGVPAGVMEKEWSAYVASHAVPFKKKQ